MSRPANGSCRPESDNLFFPSSPDRRGQKYIKEDFSLQGELFNSHSFSMLYEVVCFISHTECLAGIVYWLVTGMRKRGRVVHQGRCEKVFCFLSLCVYPVYSFMVDQKLFSYFLPYTCMSFRRTASIA